MLLGHLFLRRPCRKDRWNPNVTLPHRATIALIPLSQNTVPMPPRPACLYRHAARHIIPGEIQTAHQGIPGAGSGGKPRKYRAVSPDRNNPSKPGTGHRHHPGARVLQVSPPSLRIPSMNIMVSWEALPWISGHRTLRT